MSTTGLMSIGLRAMVANYAALQTTGTVVGDGFQHLVYVEGSLADVEQS